MKPTDGGEDHVPIDQAIVAPTLDDPIARQASGAIGGPLGRRALIGANWWTPLRVALAVVIVVGALGIARDSYCRASNWTAPNKVVYAHACYSDIPHMYRLRGFAQRAIPYIDKGSWEQLEYPVLTGAIMTFSALVTRATSVGSIDDEAGRFYDINAWLMVIAAAVAVWATVRTAGRRPWDGVMAASAPVIALAGTINWDLAAVALLAVGMLAWSRREPGLAGILIGLATATKLYPALVLGPLFILCLRAGRLREYGSVLLGAIVSWAIVNVPVMLVAFDGWQHFYLFSKDRGADLGSIWLIFSQAGWQVDVDTLNKIWVATLVILCLGIAWLGLAAPRRPRFASLAFLVVAAFALTIKVYSPQYAIWLVPLAVLAGPRWRDFLIWQACEVIYYFGVFLYLLDGVADGRGLKEHFYWMAIGIHLLGTLYFVVMVIRDIMRPEYDPVRADGSDDPSGGVLDGAPDYVSLVSRPRDRAVA
jgi:uncharacterized membrane protein